MHISQALGDNKTELSLLPANSGPRHEGVTRVVGRMWDGC
jgi:hypothetical protein